jgi:hypothetical protein
VFGVDRLIVGASGAHGAVLIPVIAWEPPGGDRDERFQNSGYLRLACQDLADQRLRDALIAVWGEIPPGPLVQPLIARGPPGRVLVDLACHPGDVLIVGAGRRGTLARVAFSKVSRYCLAHAQCPILAIPPPALAREVRHSRLAWLFWHRPLTPDQILRDQPTA